MGLQLMGQGTSVAGLQAYVLSETALPEGTPVQLDLTLRYRFPGFDTAAGALSSAMTVAGVTPWSGYPPCEADPIASVWHLRWVKGQPFLPVLIDLLESLIVLGIVVAVLVVGWYLYRTLRGVAPALPWIVGGLAAVFIGVPLGKAAYDRYRERHPKPRGGS